MLEAAGELQCPKINAVTVGPLGVLWQLVTPCHRLDSVTSGTCISAASLSTERLLRKNCRVEGNIARAFIGRYLTFCTSSAA